MAWFMFTIEIPEQVQSLYYYMVGELLELERVTKWMRTFYYLS